MRHIIIGGDGFVGRHLAQDLAALGEEVVVADVQQTAPNIYEAVRFERLDVTDQASVDAFDFRATDMVYNVAAKMLSPIVVQSERYDFFWPVNYHGVERVLRRMHEVGCSRFVQFTTDMVYGHTLTVPTTESHPANPLGEYGASKLATERLCEQYRERGMRITIFRPRLIIGPGRLGILQKLFTLVDNNLPVPMIGFGSNQYQFISVYDCASAARLAWQAGVPNAAYNLGSKNPPTVRQLLSRLIKEAGSYSFLLPTWAPAVKATLSALDWANLPIMDPEQYKIADEVSIRDTSAAERDLGWQPTANDVDMLLAAYAHYRTTVKNDRSLKKSKKELMPTGTPSANT